DGGLVGPGFGLDRGFMGFAARGGGVEAEQKRAVEFLDQAGDGPWFLMVHTYEVHAPYEPPEGTFEIVMQRNPGGLLGRTPEPHRFYDFAQERKPVPAKVVKTLSDLYDEEVRYTDGIIGRLLTKLRIDGRYDDTVICLTSDHGEEFGEHGLLGHGDTLYFEQLHVPLLLRLPKAERGGTLDPGPCSLIDLAPTLLDAAGMNDLREETTFIGRSLLDPTLHRSPVYALRNSAERGSLHMIRQGGRVVIRGRYFLHRPRGARANREYYDLASDPKQTKSDLSGANKRIAGQLARHLESYAESVGQAQVEGSEAALGAAAMAELNKLGY
ncbi:MAG: sulfatase-like hydrolase/transferase, partial [Planctomycetota bacterium]|nr:sulfatase-like hydrolase/transferase [Planctomycetota bacterium]